MNSLDIVAIDGRLNALVAQRDNAMNQYVMLAGEYASLKSRYDALTSDNTKEATHVPD